MAINFNKQGAPKKKPQQAKPVKRPKPAAVAEIIAAVEQQPDVVNQITVYPAPSNLNEVQLIVSEVSRTLVPVTIRVEDAVLAQWQEQAGISWRKALGLFVTRAMVAALNRT